MTLLSSLVDSGAVIFYMTQNYLMNLVDSGGSEKYSPHSASLSMVLSNLRNFNVD